MEYRLQNILIPDLTVCSDLEMYYRAANDVVLEKDKLAFGKKAVCEFNTYFNSFSLNKWNVYTNIENLMLSLELKGRFIVEVYTACFFRGKVAKECVYVNDKKDVERGIFNVNIDISNNDSVYFRLVALDNECEFYGGYYYTDIQAEKLNKVEIDIVMCTFKREKYIKKNLQLLKEKFFANKKYNGAGHFVIKVVDNGQTLEPEVATKDGIIKLYPNINVGGSGGFCRGMIESLHEGNATHILFMDDDVLVQIEAFERTYNLLTMLKTEYKNEFVGGAMFRFDNKYLQHENSASYKAYCSFALKNRYDMREYKSVLANERIDLVDKNYAAWWYCCIPSNIASLNNLPYPFFIRMDDIEYSIRNVKRIITLNGISVWHEAFDKKYSTLMENYFSFRNDSVVNCIHGNASKKYMVLFLMRRFVREIFRYDYKGASLLLDGMERFFEGPEFFKNVDTVKDLQEHGAKQIKTVPIESLDVKEKLYDRYMATISPDNRDSTARESFFHKYLRYITINGHLLPNILFDDFGYAEYGYTSNARHYFMRKKVLGCDLDFVNGAVLEINRMECFCLILRWLKVSASLLCNYNSITKEYKKAFPEMTSEDFWRRYLRLDK